jgi:hypothetical protein
MQKKTPEEIIKNAKIFINQQESFLVFIRNINYYIVSLLLSFMKILIYSKSYSVTHLTIKNKKEEVNLFDEKLIILDNGLRIYNIFIPYESVMRFGVIENSIIIYFFGQLEIDDKTIKISFEKSEASLSFRVKNKNDIHYIQQNIKLNMYYHIKYNKVDKHIIEKIV